MCWSTFPFWFVLYDIFPDFKVYNHVPHSICYFRLSPIFKQTQIIFSSFYSLSNSIKFHKISQKSIFSNRFFFSSSLRCRLWSRLAGWPPCARDAAPQGGTASGASGGLGEMRRCTSAHGQSLATNKNPSVGTVGIFSANWDIQLSTDIYDIKPTYIGIYIYMYDIKPSTYPLAWHRTSEIYIPDIRINSYSPLEFCGQKQTVKCRLWRTGWQDLAPVNRFLSQDLTKDDG